MRHILIMLAVLFPGCPALGQGGCCFSDDGGVTWGCDVIAFGECVALGGKWRGEGTTCSGLTCNGTIGGGCRLASGACINFTSSGACTTVGGVYLGNGVFCTELDLGGEEGADAWTEDRVLMMVNTAQASLMWVVAIVYLIGVGLGWSAHKLLTREGAGTWSLKRGGV
jgi:hypothetical protein